MSPTNHKVDRCPLCEIGRLKTWRELDDEERMLAEKLPQSAKYGRDVREKHRFCTRCWFETDDDRISKA